MTIHVWEVRNVNDDLICTIITNKKDIEQASRKLKARFNENSCFVKLSYKHEVKI